LGLFKVRAASPRITLDSREEQPTDANDDRHHRQPFI
jgi:hypothetical protein